MICNDLTSAEKVPFKIDGRIMFRSDRFEMVHLTLQPGDSMELHSQPMDVVFFVLEGTGTLMFTDESHNLPENTSIFVEKGTPRAWKNESPGLVRLLVNKLL
jgi:quercetin dioxygenase-like cupin family protein